MAGWNLQNGNIIETNIDDDTIRCKFNYVFSDSCKKRNTYKFGFIKSLLDSLLSCEKTEYGCFISFEYLFGRFAENYWNLVVKYKLHQARKDGKSELSKVEKIFFRYVNDNPYLELIEFEKIDNEVKYSIIKHVTTECKKYVVGALYSDFDGTIYSFDLKDKGIVLSMQYYEYMLKYRIELERLNYYSWAKFLEKINDETALVRVIDKLELSTPKRNDLSLYREILRQEFEDNTCFYCGKILGKRIHVDHFIPWSYTRNDKIWNFVLACPRCNRKKSDKLPKERDLNRILSRNAKFEKCQADIVVEECKNYSDELLVRLWKYASISGLKEM